jgi:hypothetical protein
VAKDLIIGAFKNLSYDQLKPYIHSVNDTDFKGDKVLIGIDVWSITKDLIEKESGWKVIDVKTNGKGQIHMERFWYIYHYLRQHPEYRYVITTDTRDVVFQTDPVEYVEEHITNFNTIAVSECIKIKNEDWNKQNIKNCFNDMLYEIEEQEVLNVGTIAGHADKVKDLCYMIYQMSLNKNDWVSDQSAYNVLMRLSPFVENTLITGLEDRFSCNLHITHKPIVKEQLAEYITQTPAHFDGSRVLNKFNQPYSIVHQYDRCPTMNEYFLNKYK